MNLAEKQQAVQSLSESFGGANAAYLVSFQGCTCEQLTKLRRDLRPLGATFAVVKNTLAKIAIKESDSAGLTPEFRGPVGVVWTKSDPVSPAKVIFEFAKKQEKFSIKAGVFEGKVIKASEVEALATLPSKEELLSKLLALINTPATRLLQTMNAPATDFVRLLEAWRQEVEKR